MDKIKHIRTPLTAEVCRSLRIGDQVLLSGQIYTARDKAHQRLVEMLDRGDILPVDLTGNVIYYAGPTPAKPGSVIGSVGPTTSSRMDAFSPRLLKEAHLQGMIGKGARNVTVKEAIVSTDAVYFVAIGGTGAQIAQSVISAEIVAFEDLGTEAIRLLEVVDLPLIVACDCFGGDLFVTGPEQYRRKTAIL